MDPNRYVGSPIVVVIRPPTFLYPTSVITVLKDGYKGWPVRADLRSCVHDPFKWKVQLRDVLRRDSGPRLVHFLFPVRDDWVRRGQSSLWRLPTYVRSILVTTKLVRDSRGILTPRVSHHSPKVHSHYSTDPSLVPTVLDFRKKKLRVQFDPPSKTQTLENRTILVDTSWTYTEWE